MEKEIWFKRKLYGWGWYPSSWQGFVLMILFILSIIWSAYYFLPDRMTEYFISIILAVIILIWICYKKGEKPRWSWGN